MEKKKKDNKGMEIQEETSKRTDHHLEFEKLHNLGKKDQYIFALEKEVEKGKDRADGTILVKCADSSVLMFIKLLMRERPLVRAVLTMEMMTELLHK